MFMDVSDEWKDNWYQDVSDGAAEENKRVKRLTKVQRESWKEWTGLYEDGYTYVFWIRLYPAGSIWSQWSQQLRSE